MQNTKVIKFLKELNLPLFNENELVEKDIIIFFFPIICIYLPTK